MALPIHTPPIDDDTAPHDHRRYLRLALVTIVVVFGGFAALALSFGFARNPSEIVSGCCRA